MLTRDFSSYDLHLINSVLTFSHVVVVVVVDILLRIWSGWSRRLTTLKMITCCLTVQVGRSSLSVALFALSCPVSLSVCLSVCLCVCLSVCLSVHLCVTKTSSDDVERATSSL